jgi:predicted site-specific integrase-resolvase
LGQVAIYCRVSTDDQSCERQERDLRAFAKGSGHEIVAIFRETASGAKNDRAKLMSWLLLAMGGPSASWRVDDMQEDFAIGTAVRALPLRFRVCPAVVCLAR